MENEIEVNTAGQTPVFIDLSFGSVLSNAFRIGYNNLFPLIGCFILWAVTVWIPYINIGTTIALTAIIIDLSKGNIINPTSIFNRKYRKYMGEYFLLIGLVFAGIMGGFLLFLIPGIVISIAWGQATYLLIDKELNPMEAISSSNRITYGHKWQIFLPLFVLFIIYEILIFLFMNIGGVIGVLLIIALMLLFIAIIYGANAYIYGELQKKL